MFCTRIYHKHTHGKGNHKQGVIKVTSRSHTWRPHLSIAISVEWVVSEEVHILRPSKLRIPVADRDGFRILQKLKLKLSKVLGVRRLNDIVEIIKTLKPYTLWKSSNQQATNGNEKADKPPKKYRAYLSLDQRKSYLKSEIKTQKKYQKDKVMRSKEDLKLLAKILGGHIPLEYGIPI
ncbi:hypothetical protein Trydic_g14710 [Trypoxylus dichotomus]